MKIFCTAARTLNFNKTAKELFITQPAISKNIKSLEDYYHVRLFERLGSKLELTAAGRTMLSHCEKLLSDYDALSYAMHLFNQETAGRLRLGASTTIAQYVLPEILAAFTELYPDIEISLINGNSRAVEQALYSHEIELGLVEGVFKSTGLNYCPFMQDELKVIARSELKLPATLSLEDFCNRPLVLREHGSGTLDVIVKTLAAHNLKMSDLKVRMYLGSTEGIKLFLRHSDCLGIISAFALRTETNPGLQHVKIDDVSFKRQFNLVLAPGPVSPLLERFRDFLIKAAYSDNFKLS